MKRSTNAASAKALTNAATTTRAARVRQGIGDIMAGVRLTGPPQPVGSEPAKGAPTGGNASDTATDTRTTQSSAPSAGRNAQTARELRHPVASGVAFERVDNIYRMDPRKIVLEGPYVRQFIEDGAFYQLKAAVETERDIGQHVGVRLVGPPTDRRRVLVYGMRRWKAALAVGLDRVPVRDYGTISEEKAIELQMLENEIRADPHPVDTALGFHLLAQQAGWNQTRIAQVFDKNKGYVSEMVRAGEAIGRLREGDRQPLYTAPRVTVRAFQALAQIRSVEERKEALLALVTDESDGSGASTALANAGRDASASDGTASGASGAASGQARAPDDLTTRRRLVDESVFHARLLRNGRSFRVRWTDDDLRRDGTHIAEEFRARFLDEYQHLLHRTAVLHGQVPGQGSTATPRIAELVASAAQETARVDARIVGTAAARAENERAEGGRAERAPGNG